MDNYGIECEGELFSGSFSALRNRLSDRENDDMSYYTTTKVIEQRLIGIFGAARKAFFGDLFLSCTEKKKKDKCRIQIENRNLKQYYDRVCLNDAPMELKKLASAYYIIGYGNLF